MINTIVGDYYLIERGLGRDQFGPVYFGRDTRWTQEVHPVAIRLLDTNLTRLPGFAARFADVAPRLEKWNQLYITRILAQGVVRNTQEGETYYYLVSETPSLETLDAYLKRVQGHLNQEQLALFFEKVAAGVEFAHRNNIFHGNLNLWNITVRDNGVEANPEIADFGLMQMLLPYPLPEQEKLIGWKVPVGVPEFIAPERFRGDAPSKSNDVYVLGVLLYYMLSGRLPFNGTFEQLVLAHSYQQPPSLGPLVRHGPELHQMLLRPLSKTPADRIGITDMAVRYRQITGLPRTMLPIIETHPALPTPPGGGGDARKKGGWFGLR